MTPREALQRAMKAALPGAFLQSDDLALGSEAAEKSLADSSYVLVNAELLAAALQRADGVQGFGGPEMAKVWAAAILAALQQGEGERDG